MTEKTQSFVERLHEVNTAQEAILAATLRNAVRIKELIRDFEGWELDPRKHLIVSGAWIGAPTTPYGSDGLGRIAGLPVEIRDGGVFLADSAPFGAPSTKLYYNYNGTVNIGVADVTYVLDPGEHGRLKRLGATIGMAPE